MIAEEAVGTRAGQISAETTRILLAGRWPVIAYLAVMIAAGTAVDMAEYAASSDFALTTVGVVASYFLTIKLIEYSGIAPHGLQAGIGTYFGMSLVIGLATIGALFLFALPGLYLTIRWSAAYGYAFAAEHTTSDALRQSWRATSEHIWPIAAVMILPICAFAIGLALYFIHDTAPVSWTIVLPANMLISASATGFTAIGLAVFTLVANPNAGISDVFE